MAISLRKSKDQGPHTKHKMLRGLIVTLGLGTLSQARLVPRQTVSTAMAASNHTYT